MKWNPYYITTIVFCKYFFKFLCGNQIIGLENIPPKGKFIVAPNHLSHLDPPLIGGTFISRELMFMARKTLFKPGFWNWLLSRINVIPVDKENSAEIQSIRTAIKCLKNDMGLVIFPEGTRSIDGEIGTAQPGLGFIAHKTQAPIIPVKIINTNKILRKNTVVPDFSQSTKIIIGKPIEFAEYASQISNANNKYQEISDYILNKIKTL